MTQQRLIFTLIGLVSAFVVLAGLWSSTPTVTASSPPPRPTLTRTPNIAQGQAGGSSIELRVPTDNINLWTVVQWQDSRGSWHDVETWRGILDEIHNHTGDKLWWVYPRDYGTGPFRWLVYDRPNGHVLATSRSFHLPAASHLHEIVEVTLK